MPSLTAARVTGGIQGTIAGFTQPTLALDLSGGSSLELTGRAGTLTTALSGGSTLNAYGCPADTAVVPYQGGARCA